MKTRQLESLGPEALAVASALAMIGPAQAEADKTSRPGLAISYGSDAHKVARRPERKTSVIPCTAPSKSPFPCLLNQPSIERRSK